MKETNIFCPWFYKELQDSERQLIYKSHEEGKNASGDVKKE